MSESIISALVIQSVYPPEITPLYSTSITLLTGINFCFNEAKFIEHIRNNIPAYVIKLNSKDFQYVRIPDKKKRGRKPKEKPVSTSTAGCIQITTIHPIKRYFECADKYKSIQNEIVNNKLVETILKETTMKIFSNGSIVIIGGYDRINFSDTLSEVKNICDIIAGVEQIPEYVITPPTTAMTNYKFEFSRFTIDLKKLSAYLTQQFNKQTKLNKASVIEYYESWIIVRKPEQYISTYLSDAQGIKPIIAYPDDIATILHALPEAKINIFRMYIYLINNRLMMKLHGLENLVHMYITHKLTTILQNIRDANKNEPTFSILNLSSDKLQRVEVYFKSEVQTKKIKSKSKIEGSHSTLYIYQTGKANIRGSKIESEAIYAYKWIHKFIQQNPDIKLPESNLQ